MGLVRGACLLLLSVSIGLSSTACTPDADLRFWTDKVLVTSSDHFTIWWLDAHAKARGTEVSTVLRWWNQGRGRLDTEAAKTRGYWNLSTDFCSGAPDTGPHFDFRKACTRHDWAWRNLKRMDQRHHVSSFNTRSKRRAANEVFLRDMREDCARRNVAARALCFSTASAYKVAVDLAA
jgi:hypothetical protein